MATVDLIMQYEDGSITQTGVLTLFAELIRTGTAWQLQGSIYGRPARHLIKEGYITAGGEITAKGQAIIDQDNAREVQHE